LFETVQREINEKFSITPLVVLGRACQNLFNVIVNTFLKRGHGLSKLRVRGLVKCRVNVGLKVLAQNFKRFARYMLERAKKAIGERQGGEVRPYWYNKW